MNARSHIEYASSVFGFDPPVSRCPVPAELPQPEPGGITIVIGPSGAGKTLALRALLTPDARELVPLPVAAVTAPVLELFDPDLPTDQVLRVLARVGLADGRLWRMQAGDLSAGECRRLELALAICGAKRGSLLIADEFDAHLDSTSARALAQNLRRIALRLGLRVAASTHRPETLAQLAPSRLFEIRSGVANEHVPPPAADLCDEIEIVQGTVRDYADFEHWHYLGPGRPGPNSGVFLARHNGRAVGIVMFGYPHLLLSARALVLPQFAPGCIRSGGASALNQQVRVLQRIVVDPHYRGLGIARRLIAHGLSQLDVPYVECIAQMGEFSDFLLAPGFRRVCEMPPPRAALRLLKFAEQHGFAAQALVDPAVRELLIKYLPEPVSAQLTRLLRALVHSRIETGHGSLRGQPGSDHEPLLHKALARINARPIYFLWTNGASP